MIDPRSVRAVIIVLWDELMTWLVRKSIAEAVDRATTLPAPTKEESK